jgi:hypothetical protein
LRQRFFLLKAFAYFHALITPFMKAVLLLSSICLTFLACTKRDFDHPSPPVFDIQCEKKVAIDSFQYGSDTTQTFIINSAKIEGNCISINYKFTGCDYVFGVLIDEGIVMDTTSPIQRNLRLIIPNADTCLRNFSQQINFDLTPTEVSGKERIQFNLQGWEMPIIYKY